MTPYAEGVFARQAGRSLSDNPYADERAALWAAGWNAADDHILGR